jgi:hypothetical protein
VAGGSDSFEAPKLCLATPGITEDLTQLKDCVPTSVCW